MNKKTILLAVILLLVVALIVVAVVLLNPGKNGEEQTPGTADNAGGSTNKGDGDEVDGIAGVEDSIFDDENPPQDDTSAGQQGNTADDDDEQTGSSEPSDSTTTPGTDSDTTPPVTDDTPDEDEGMTYEKFSSMEPAKQREYQESFKDIDAFFEWYNAAKEKYEKEHPSIEVGDGSVDLEQIAGGNG